MTSRLLAGRSNCSLWYESVLTRIGPDARRRLRAPPPIEGVLRSVPIPCHGHHGLSREASRDGRTPSEHISKPSIRRVPLKRAVDHPKPMHVSTGAIVHKVIEIDLDVEIISGRRGRGFRRKRLQPVPEFEITSIRTMIGIWR